MTFSPFSLANFTISVIIVFIQIIAAEVVKEYLGSIIFRKYEFFKIKIRIYENFVVLYRKVFETVLDVSKIFEIMEKRNISNKQLADAIGVSPGNVSDWKSGRSKPSAEVLVKIAKFLNVSVDYLLGNSSGSQIDQDFSVFLADNDLAAYISYIKEYPELKDILRMLVQKPERISQITKILESLMEMD